MRYWKFINLDGSTNSAQSCSNDKHVVPDAVEMSKAEFNSFIASLPVIEPTPPRDLVAETDNLKTKLADYDELKAKVAELEAR